MTSKFLLPLLLLPALATAQAAGAGTVINNQASASYLLGGSARVVNSPVAPVTVNSVCSVVVTPNGTVDAPSQQASALPGQSVTFAYQVVNTGNGPATYSVQGRTEAGSAFTPGLQVYQDSNGNGQLDAGDSPATSVTLNAGAAAPLLLIASNVGSSGWAAVNLIASCPNGAAQDSNNVARVNVTPPPVLSVTKSFDQERIRPGDQTTVTVTARNDGEGIAKNVLLTDPLAAQVAQGLQYVPGSARSSGVLEYSADGVTWSTSEPATGAGSVQAVRARIDTLGSGQQASLTFALKATDQAEKRTFVNVANLEAAYGGGEQAQAKLAVNYQPGVALGPLGNAGAPEGSAADAQSKPFAVIGQQICFDHTLQNTGDVADTFTLTVTYPQGQASATYLDSGGQTLTLPVALEAGASTSVRVCYTPQTGTTALQAVITAAGKRGTSNATTDSVARIESQYPRLVKTVSKPGSPGWTSSDAVTTGDTLSYTLSVTNPYTQSLNDVTVSDPLPAHTDLISAPNGGQVTGAVGTQVVTWQVGTLQPGETRTFTVQVRVSDRSKDDEALSNIFNMTSTEFTTPVESNAATAYVWNAAPFIAKSVDALQVAPGDQLTYTLTLRNTSASSALVDVLVTDTPASGLQYVPGSSLLDGQPLADPTIQNGSLTWPVPRLDAGTPVKITYKLRVLPGASGDLVNTVIMLGHGEKARATAIASKRAHATTRVRLLNFAPLSDILGTVFLDRNGDGKLGQSDTGVSGARVVLAGGRIALTDAQGRYHFDNVQLGMQALRLDPASVPVQPRGAGTVTVQVQGLTTVDFALDTTNAVTALRDIDLTAGSLSVHKAVVRTGSGYHVTLTLTTPQDIAHLKLLDPLPGDARINQGQSSRGQPGNGQNSFDGTLKAGTTTLTYDFDWSGDPASAVTDPVVTLGGQP